MSGSPQVTNASAFKEGSLGLQVGLSIITGGLYWLYWFYSTASQLDDGTNQDLMPILAIIPFINILLMWQLSNAAEAVTDQSGVVLFVLFLFFPPLAWYWVQSGINSAAA